MEMTDIPLGKLSCSVNIVKNKDGAHTGRLSPQSEKFLLQQNEKFLLTTGKMAGWKRRSCCSRSEIGID